MSSTQFLESLEARIAPAVFKPTTYSDPVFTDVTSASADPNIQALFSGATAGEYYYATLKSGDDLQVFNSTSGFGSLVKVSGGEMLVFFHNDGGLGDLTFSANEISGVSLGAKSKVAISDSVGGDIVANYNATTHTIDTTSLISDQQTITGVYVAGSVDGRIIAGGAIANVEVVGTVERVATGTAAVVDSADPGVFYTYDFGGGTGLGDAQLTAFTLGAKKAGASISNVKVGTLFDDAALNNYGSIIAGDGGAGGAGGSVSGVIVVADTDGFSVLAGSGGDGSGSATSGGAGGKISNIRILGVADSTANDLITIQAGDGGVGTGAGKGGVGGTVGSVYVGYDLPQGKNAVRSANLLLDDVAIIAGNGGTGKAAGSGGSVQTVYVAVSAPDGTGDEIFVAGGDGGADNGAQGGKGGAGGSLTNIDLRNFNDTVAGLGSTTLAQGGDGGSATTAGTGGVGGSVKDATFHGFGVSAVAGEGADGFVKGGNGGVIQNVDTDVLGNIIAQQVFFVAGSGGDANKGAGGIGGNVSGIFLPAMDLGAGNLVVAAGSGGSSVNSTGGKGGILSTVQVIDAPDTANAGLATFASGTGGDGGKKGGIGGDILNLTVAGYNFDAAITAGAGGSATISGAGANGGSVKNSGIAVESDSADNFVTVSAGVGGGSAVKGKAGAGGSVLSSNFNADGDTTISAGVGGAGATGTSGAGGSVTSVGAVSGDGSVSVSAGDAGDAATAVKGANGGNLTNLSISALYDVTILAGDGTGGGSGGNLQTINYTGADISGPIRGDIVIRAGDGSTSFSGAIAGKGGFIKTLNGYASAYDTAGTATTALIKAGDGADGSKKGGDGGYISDLNIYGGTFLSNGVTVAYANMTIWAGEAGDSSSSGVGGKGGSISNVSLAEGKDVTTDTIIGVSVANVLAGDGGDSASGKGGIGGSVTNFFSLGDIGTRSGKAYGFDSTDLYAKMGGIFAGTGGTGTKGNGLAGNVISVTADAISSIVAGKFSNSPDFVNKVDGIFLNGSGNDDPEIDTDGSFTNWDTAVFVGGIAGDPNAPDADVFKLAGNVSWQPGDVWQPGVTQPLDGLIAALELTSKRNFSPMAYLTLNGSTAEFAGVRVPVA